MLTIWHGLRFSKIQQMQASDYPHVPVEEFDRWKRLELASVYLLFLGLILLIAPYKLAQLMGPSKNSHGTSQTEVIVFVFLAFVSLGGFLGCLIVAAVLGSMAARLRKKFGIIVDIRTQKQGEVAFPPQNASFPGPSLQRPSVVSFHRPAAPVNPWPGVVLGLLVLVLLAVIGYNATRPAASSPPTSFVAAVTGTTPSSDAHSSPSSPPRPTQRTPKRVLALYYPWYQTPAVSHTWAHQSGVDTARQRMATHTHYPTQGPYDSADPAVIDRHLQQAAAAGIDTLVCSWWGRKDPTDNALRILLAHAARTHITVCVLWERLTPPATSDTTESDLTYLVQTFGKQPAYLQVDGKPVLFAFDPVVLHVYREDWLQLRHSFETRFPPGVFLLGQGLNPENAPVWNGQYTLGIASQLRADQSLADIAGMQHQTYAATLESAQQTQKVSVETVLPGYDDRKYNAKVGLPANSVDARQDGQLYNALWQQAIADDPDWILVNSFNQWHAGTEIEPSVQLGTGYLKLTRQFAEKFRDKKFGARKFKARSADQVSSDWSNF